MQTLILSCNTGAGHNSCALAIQEVYHEHGEPCRITDALQFISKRASRFISNWHTRIYLHAPRLFGAGYQSVETRETIFREGTLLYQYLSSGAERMYRYISGVGYDNVICTHVFPALALTEMCRRHPELRLTTSHISTDYTCSPCTADSALDWYFLPDGSLAGEFVRCGIPQEKLVASGIPVRRAFCQRISLEEGKRRIGLDPAQRHILMMCGSMGCGPMEALAEIFYQRLTAGQVLSVVCGTNEELRGRLQKQFGGHPRMRILGKADNVPQLMQGADLFLTKPGGLSTSEAAAAGVPMVLIDAVAGCEEHNLDFFLRDGMAVTADTPEALADTALALLENETALAAMRAAAAAHTSRAAEAMYEWLRTPTLLRANS